MSEHTPSVPLTALSVNWQRRYSTRKRCISCGEILANQYNQDYYKCTECGFECTEYTTEE